jgi:hypothetical protein
MIMDSKTTRYEWSVTLSQMKNQKLFIRLTIVEMHFISNKPLYFSDIKYIL